ncbi:MAG: ABC transporter ATP-binding protein [Actinobacteria bacterium]|nr:ABC transporter ATP-binding protein [Actinomycetota bacterium]
MSSMQPTQLVFRDLSVSYDTQVAVHPLSLTVPAGGWLCLIGPNGAGKSSVLRSACGLVRHRGSVTVAGQDTATMSTRHRARLLAFVPQLPLLPADMTVFDYVLLGRSPFISYFGVASARDRATAGEVLTQLDLAGFADRRLETLSGGECQRLVLARAMAQEAPVLLLDEPTSALDIGHQQQALELVDRMRWERGLTVVSAMHDLTLAGVYADRLALLHEGRLVADGSPAEVLRAEILSEFYGVSVRVHYEDDGTAIVLPNRRAR